MEGDQVGTLPLLLPALDAASAAAGVDFWARFFLILAGLAFLSIALMFAITEVISVIGSRRGTRAAARAQVPADLSSELVWDAGYGLTGAWIPRPTPPANASAARTQPVGDPVAVPQRDGGVSALSGVSRQTTDRLGQFAPVARNVSKKAGSGNSWGAA